VSRALFLAVVFSVAALVAAPSASASFSGQNGRIVFTRELFRASGAQTGDECDADPSACGPDEPRRSALGVVRPNGLDRARLPTCRIVARCEDSDGAFSPDGRRIAFERGGRLFVARADGTRVRRISTTFAGQAKQPAWSPDGRRLAFTGDRGAGLTSVYTVGLDGTGMTRVTQGQFDSTPTWASTSEIAFVRGAADQDAHQDETDVYVVQADGRRVRRLD